MVVHDDNPNIRGMKVGESEVHGRASSATWKWSQIQEISKRQREGEGKEGGGEGEKGGGRVKESRTQPAPVRLHEGSIVCGRLLTPGYHLPVPPCSN